MPSPSKGLSLGGQRLQQVKLCHYPSVALVFLTQFLPWISPFFYSFYFSPSLSGPFLSAPPSQDIEHKYDPVVHKMNIFQSHPLPQHTGSPRHGHLLLHHKTYILPVLPVVE